MRLPSLDEHALLMMWVQLLVIVAAARGLGTAMRRIGQPPVVGELLAGVLLGPSVLAKLWPNAAHVLVPQDKLGAAPINAIGWVGVAFLLVLTGFETDLKIVRSLGRSATLVAVGGLALPFVVGLGTGLVMPHDFRGNRGTMTAFVLFIAVSLSISSLPVIAKILDELGFMRRNFGQVTIAVGMVNDLIGWLALGVIAALGRSSHLTVSSVLVPVIAIAAILLVSFTVGQRAVDAVLRQVRRREGSGVDAMTVTLVVTFLLAVLTQVARSDAVLGAYIAGILIGRSRFFQRRIATQLESLTMAVFAPVFFATAGLRIDLSALRDGTALMWAGLVLAVAIFTKGVRRREGGCAVQPRGARARHRTQLPRRRRGGHRHRGPHDRRAQLHGLHRHRPDGHRHLGDGAAAAAAGGARLAGRRGGTTAARARGRHAAKPARP
jgi:Kef-type K+ transport system membrane component KefB